MTHTEHVLTSWDGSQLFYRAWIPDGGAKRAVYLFHRGHEHSGRWEETVRALGLPDTAYFAWDQRGHGKSAGERGDAPSVAALVKDADVFVRHVAEASQIPVEESVVVASSLGAVVATAWVHDYAPAIRGMVLAAPAFCVRLYVPLAIPALRLLSKVKRKAWVKSYVKARMLTHDPQEAAAYQADAAIFRQISVPLLLDLHDTGQRLLADAGAIDVPTLILMAEKDWVVSTKAQVKFFRRLGSLTKQLETYPGMFHAIFHETRRECVTNRVRGFLQDCFLQQLQLPSRLEADKGGHTKTEFDLLHAPESWNWPLVRGVMKTFGKLSKGIQLGWRTGFDSGVTLDYVYQNKASGITPIGKMIDRSYLNSPGWTGIRVRRQHLEKALEEAVEHLFLEGKRVHILDVASGPGRYVLELMARRKDIQMSATLRDYQQVNLDAARVLAESLKVTTATMQEADAFDRESLAGTQPRPTVAITSGIYELFSENQRVLRSLQGVADALEPGGFLIYTGQIWHPQVEFIARALRNHQGKPWIMRRRAQVEIDALVRAAGFQKMDQFIDRWGIFTVSVARRVP